MESFIQIIQTLGFPIACVVACGIFIYKKDKQENDNTKEREIRANEQIEKFAVSLDRFNETLSNINLKLGYTDSKIDDVKEIVNNIDSRLAKVEDKISKS